LPLIKLVAAVKSKQYIFKIATSSQDREAYFQLRQKIFCEEQGLFHKSDVDELDAIAYPIVALIDATSQVVGVVRIYSTEPRLWYGGRLGVHCDYRRAGRIGQGLIYQAVTTANAWGCDRFLATVQLPNVKFFQRLHWHSLEEITICDRPHHLMEAELEHYPSNHEPCPVVQHHYRAAS